jgi:quercetin dioxygenase-like cupin family protein
MKLLDLGRREAKPITNYDAREAWSILAASGEGRAHVYHLHFDAGGSIGRHPAGPAQLFLVTAGEGWVEGGDGKRVPLRAGEAALIEAGESHAKGSDSASGMSAVMIQVEALEAAAPDRLSSR